MCAQYFNLPLVASMPRDDICMYMAHVCFIIIIVWWSVGVCLIDITAPVEDVF